VIKFVDHRYRLEAVKPIYTFSDYDINLYVSKYILPQKYSSEKEPKSVQRIVTNRNYMQSLVKPTYFERLLDPKAIFDIHERFDTTVIYLSMLLSDNDGDLTYLKEKILGHLMVSGKNEPGHSRLVWFHGDKSSSGTISFLFIRQRHASVINFIIVNPNNQDDGSTKPEIDDRKTLTYLEKNQIDYFTSVHIVMNHNIVNYDRQKYTNVNEVLSKLSPYFAEKIVNCMVFINRCDFKVPRSMNILDNIETRGTYVKLRHVDMKNLGKHHIILFFLQYNVRN